MSNLKARKVRVVCKDQYGLIRYIIICMYISHRMRIWRAVLSLSASKKEIKGYESGNSRGLGIILSLSEETIKCNFISRAE